MIDFIKNLKYGDILIRIEDKELYTVLGHTNEYIFLEALNSNGPGLWFHKTILKNFIIADKLTQLLYK